MNISPNGWDETFKLLKGLFPDADITQDQYDIWQDDLAPMSQEDVRIAIKQLARKELEDPEVGERQGHCLSDQREQEAGIRIRRRGSGGPRVRRPADSAQPGDELG